MLGTVTFKDNSSSIDVDHVEARLKQYGFQLLEGRKEKMVRDVKKLVEEVYSGNFDFVERFRFSDLIKKRWSSYETVSDAFIAITKSTIERYIIEYRMNKVKELLIYTNDTLVDIAFRLNFNSVAHLSAQFKQHTGIAPSIYKEIKRNKAEVIFSTN